MYLVARLTVLSINKTNEQQLVVGYAIEGVPVEAVHVCFIDSLVIEFSNFRAVAFIEIRGLSRI